MPENRIIFILTIIICLFSSKIGLAQPGRKDSLASDVRILKTWNLPETLREISGISFIDAERFACVQDEIGSIFIFNLSSSVIEDTIPFATPGDYEGICIAGDDAYIACADGRIIEIAEYRSAKPVIKEYGTHLTVRQNVEGICYDKKNKRLLVAIKDEEEGSPLYKGVYEFSLAEKKMIVRPVFKIDLVDPVFAKYQSKKIR